MARQRSAGSLEATPDKRPAHRAEPHERGEQRTEMPRAALAYQLAAWTGPPVNARGGAPLTIAGLLQAQRSRGNRAVQRHLRRHTIAVSPPPSRRPSGDAPDVQQL